MKQKLKIAWFSAGVSSFISAYKAKDIDKIIYIDIADQHDDSLRFVKDCEEVLQKPIEILRGYEYSSIEYGTVNIDSVEKAIRIRGYIRLVRGGAACTEILKKRVRKKWEQEHSNYDLTYVWGMDWEEKNRADGLDISMPEFTHEFPLIKEQYLKQDCHAICRKLGIKRPVMYDMGYSNNNCVGCVKGGMGYWNKIRVDFPEVFRARAELERITGNSCLKECFLDELDPTRGRMENEIMQDCSILCELAITEET